MKPTDEAIRKRVEGLLAHDPRIEGSHIEVSVRGGETTLEGTVDSALAADAARLLAAGTKGVRRLIVRLRIADTAPASADTELRQRAARALREEPQIDASGITIRVEGGSLIVRGDVDEEWKRARVEELLGGIEGVVSVVNEIAVVPTEQPEDQLIARSIMEAAERITPSTVDTIQVTVEDGLVTLSGRVPTWMDKDALYAAALDTDGVIDVQDNLHVETTLG